MRVLLSGSSGQVGSILKTLLAPYCEVIAPGRDVLDFGKPRIMGALLDELAPTLIVNCAAFTAVDEAEMDVELAFAVNAEAPAEIACWAAKRDVPIVHFSTD